MTAYASEEDAEIRAFWGHMSSVELAARIGRTEGMVAHRARVLGLPNLRDKDFVAEITLDPWPREWFTGGVDERAGAVVFRAAVK